MSKSKWSDVAKGDRVELGGRTWLVEKIKPKGKKATVVVSLKGRRAESVVKLGDKVAIVKAPAPAKISKKLMSKDGQVQRWATKAEAKAEGITSSPGLAAGNPTITAPPAAPGASPWDTPADKIERKLDKLLEARLVGEATDESAGYYVPPANVSTVASHLALFHGGIPEACQDDETKMLSVHAAQHAEALKGSPLAVNHWHTETRPDH